MITTVAARWRVQAAVFVCAALWSELGVHPDRGG